MATAQSAHVCRPQESASSANFCLVWCYERCNKADQGQTLIELQEVAASFGSNLVLYKKSTGFLNWLERATERVLLLADWREAKPIVDGVNLLTAARSQQFHLEMCILAQSNKTYRRASEWAALIRQGGGRSIKVLDGYSREGVEEFIMQSIEDIHASCDGRSDLDPASSPAFHTHDFDATSVHSLQEAGSTSLQLSEGSASASASAISLVSLIQAVQDPEEAARLEEMIQRTMWQQPYED